LTTIVSRLVKQHPSTAMYLSLEFSNSLLQTFIWV